MTNTPENKSVPCKGSEEKVTSFLSDLTPRTTGEQAPDRELLTLARSALDAAASAIGNGMCFHESTHRGGYLWTICDDCGAKWADDRGGFQKPVMPKAFGQALQAIAAIDRAIGKTTGA